MSDQSFDTQIDNFNLKEFIQNIISKIKNLDVRIFNLETADQATGGGGGMTSFTLAGDSGPSQTISDGNTLTVAGGTGIDSVASATDTITLNIGTHNHLSSAQGGTLSLPASNITSGQVGLAFGGTGVDLSLTGPGHLIQATSGSGVSLLKHNLSAAIGPTANDDTGDGYAVGSLWIDTTADTSYFCVDATLGAAVWNTLGSGGGGMTSFLAAGDAGSAQTITNGNTLTIIGGTGIATTASATDNITIDIDTVPLANGGTNANLSATGPGYLVQETAGATITLKLNNWLSAVAPTVNEDSGDGYSVGSYWYDTTADAVYVCIDSALGAAVWKDITSSGSGSPLTVEEQDGSPTVANVTTIVVSNGTLTDDGGGQVTITTGSGGGSGTANTNDTLIWLGW